MVNSLSTINLQRYKIFQRNASLFILSTPKKQKKRINQFKIMLILLIVKYYLLFYFAVFYF